MVDLLRERTFGPWLHKNTDTFPSIELHPRLGKLNLRFEPPGEVRSTQHPNVHICRLISPVESSRTIKAELEVER